MVLETEVIKVTTTADRALAFGRIRLSGPGRIKSAMVTEVIGITPARKGDLFCQLTLRMSDSDDTSKDLCQFFGGYNYAGSHETDWIGDMPYRDGDALNLYCRANQVGTVICRIRIERRGRR